VSYTVAVNPSSSPRTASVFVAGLVFTIIPLCDRGFCGVTPITVTQVLTCSLAITDCQSPVRGSGYFADRYTFTGTANQGVAIRASSSFSGSVLYLLGPRSEERRVGKECAVRGTPRHPTGTGGLAWRAAGSRSRAVGALAS